MSEPAPSFASRREHEPAPELEPQSDIVLSHEKLEVYQHSIRFIAFSSDVSSKIPGGYGYVVDQLRRAALSVALNIAEGAGKTQNNDKRRFYAFARGSAMECGAILDAGKALRIISEEELREGKVLLVSIVRMLTKLCNIS